MGFVRIYAKMAIGLALLEAAFGLAGTRFPDAMDSAFVVVAILRTLWMFVSFIALVVFPAYSAPLWSPLFYMAFEIVSVILTIAVGSSFGKHGVNPVLGNLHHSKTPIYLANVGIAAVYLGLTVPLLFHKRPPAPAEQPAQQPVIAAQPQPAAPAVPEPQPQPAVQAVAEPQPQPAAQAEEAREELKEDAPPEESCPT